MPNPLSERIAPAIARRADYRIDKPASAVGRPPYSVSIQNPTLPRTSRARPQAAGFTLIEVMIALAILGMSLFILLDMHYNAVHVQNRLENEVKVRNLLSLAVGMSEVEIAVGTLKDSQEFGDRYPGWRYTFDAQEVEPSSSSSLQTANTPAFPGLYDVLVTIEDPDKAAVELQYYTVVRTDAAQQGATGDAAADGDTGGENPPPAAGALE